MLELRDSEEEEQKAQFSPKFEAAQEILKQTEYRLEKLPVWGMQIREHEINFEWPTQEMFDKMD